jgi:hypothetical protein
MKDKLSTEILQKLESQKMINGWVFRLQNWLLVALVIVFVFLASFLWASFLVDFREIQEIYNSGNLFRDFWLNIWQNSFLELVFLALLVSLFIYWIYRRTDWLLVRYKNWLLFGVLLTVFLVGSLASLAEKKHFESVQQNLEKVNYRGKRRENLAKVMKNLAIFRGKIKEISSDDFQDKFFIKVENPESAEVFWWNGEFSPDLNEQKPEERARNIILSRNRFSQNVDQNINNMERNIAKNWGKKLQKPELFIGQRVLINYQKINENGQEKLVIIQIRPF